MPIASHRGTGLPTAPRPSASSRSRTLRGLGLLAVAASLLLTSVGCSVNTPVEAPHPDDVAELPRPAEIAYRLQAGDTLAVRFYNNPELDDEQPIRPDGLISMPFVGQVTAAGQTPGELEAELVKLYTGELASPRVSVIVREFAPQRYYIGGEVGEPGAYPMHGNLSLLQALQEAGGLMDTARRQQVILIRAGADGVRRGYAIDMRRVLSGEVTDQVVWLHPQDAVFVPRSRIGNVNLFVERFVRGVLPIVPGIGLQFDATGEN